MFPLLRIHHTCNILATQLLSFSSVTLATKSFFSKWNLNLVCPASKYSTFQSGSLYTANYKLYMQNEDKIISPFHDIPMLADREGSIYNMVVEIPKWTNAKMEISTKDKMNPIKQDIKKGKIRFVKNLFPYKGYIWNYGAIPQTWENPDEVDEHTGEKGDGDPIDIIELGHQVSYMGEVKQVKVLGVLGLVDDGETDWKVIAIDVNDPLAPKLNDIEDVRHVMPGLLEATHEWFAAYKMPGSDTPPNKFAFEGEAKGKEFANTVIQETHEHWKRLVLKEIENVNNLACENTVVENSPYLIDEEKANDVVSGLPALMSPAPLPNDIDVMYYLTDEEKRGEK